MMVVLPVTEIVARQFQVPGIPGSALIVQQLTLWIGMLGGMLASRSDRLLGSFVEYVSTGKLARSRQTNQQCYISGGIDSAGLRKLGVSAVGARGRQHAVAGLAQIRGAGHHACGICGDRTARNPACQP